MTDDVRINLMPNTQAKVWELTAAQRTVVEDALVGYLDEVASQVKPFFHGRATVHASVSPAVSVS